MEIHVRGYHSAPGQGQPLELPESLLTLQSFIRLATRIGPQMALLQGSVRLSMLEEAAIDLLSVLRSWRPDELTAFRCAKCRQSVAEALVGAAILVDAIPFHRRVPVWLRSLTPCYQAVYIIHNLLSLLDLRLRQAAGELPVTRRLPPENVSGHMLEGERAAFEDVAVFWRNEEWDVYEFV